MYEQRCIAFIDILGFGALVEQSAGDIDLQQMIYEALDSLHNENINEETYSRVNEEIVPAERLDSVKEIAKVFNQAMKLAHPVLITFFSDSVVISAKSEDVLASQLVLDLSAKLCLRLWQDHNLLIRGGITIGELIHKENGPLFGPAMNRAYFLESKKAINPRVIIDGVCLDYYLKTQTFKPMRSLITEDNEFAYMSLATAFVHTISHSTEALVGNKVTLRHRQSLSTTIKRLSGIQTAQNIEEIISKYKWLISQIAQISPELIHS